MGYFKSGSLIFAISLFTLFCSTEQVLLDDEGKFDLDWALNEDKSSVTFTIKVTNDPEGFVALGVSPASTMTNSDIAVYEIKNGKKQLQVRSRFTMTLNNSFHVSFLEHLSYLYISTKY